MADQYGRTSSLPFLDQAELEARELRSARVEGREPDFSVENLNPLYHEQKRILQEQEEALEKARAGRKIHKLELDMNDPTSIQKAIELLMTHKDNLEKEGDTTPSSLLPGVPDPTRDNSVTPENANVPVPTVPTENTVRTDEREQDNVGPDPRDYSAIPEPLDQKPSSEVKYPFVGDERIESAKGRDNVTYPNPNQQPEGETVPAQPEDNEGNVPLGTQSYDPKQEQADNFETVGIPEFNPREANDSTTPVADDEHGIVSDTNGATFSTADARDDAAESKNED